MCLMTHFVVVFFKEEKKDQRYQSGKILEFGWLWYDLFQVRYLSSVTAAHLFKLLFKTLEESQCSSSFKKPTS